MVKIISIPSGYVEIRSGFTDRPLAELGVIANPDTRIGLEKME